MDKINTKKLAQAALLLSLCIVSQFFKNLSVYITGPIINACLIIAVLAVGLSWALVLCAITPVTSFFITGSPIMAGIPAVIPAIMAGNAILVLCVFFFHQKWKSRWHLPAGMLVGSVCKALFMGIVIVKILLASYGSNIASRLPNPDSLPKVLEAAKLQFSVTQLVTALIGSALAYLVWMPLQKYLQNEH